jgi:hypothetical protein
MSCASHLSRSHQALWGQQQRSKLSSPPSTSRFPRAPISLQSFPKSWRMRQLMSVLCRLLLCGMPPESHLSPQKLLTRGVRGEPATLAHLLSCPPAGVPLPPSSRKGLQRILPVSRGARRRNWRRGGGMLLPLLGLCLPLWRGLHAPSGVGTGLVDAFFGAGRPNIRVVSRETKSKETAQPSLTCSSGLDMAGSRHLPPGGGPGHGRSGAARGCFIRTAVGMR